MIIRAAEAQARAILVAMRDIALTHGAGEVTDADRRTIEAAATIVLGLPDGAAAGLAPCPPGALARAVADDADQAAQAVRMLAVMSLVGGRIDPGKIALVREYADAVGVHESYVAVLAEAAAGEIAAAAACMIRKTPRASRGSTLPASTPTPLPRSSPTGRARRSRPRRPLRGAGRAGRRHLRARLLRALQAQRLRLPR